jgi:hypothetical protein
MTLEQALQAGLTVVVGGLCYFFRLFWIDRQRMRKEIVAIRKKMESLNKALGRAQGIIKAYMSCGHRECPLVDLSDSIEKDGLDDDDEPAIGSPS